MTLFVASGAPDGFGIHPLLREIKPETLFLSGRAHGVAIPGLDEQVRILQLCRHSVQILFHREGVDAGFGKMYSVAVPDAVGSVHHSLVEEGIVGSGEGSDDLGRDGLVIPPVDVIQSCRPFPPVPEDAGGHLKVQTVVRVPQILALGAVAGGESDFPPEPPFRGKVN